MRFWLLLLLFLPLPVLAQVSSDESVVLSAGGDITVVPDGTGESLADVGATITLKVMDADGQPIAGLPAQDIWLENLDSVSLASCSPQFADAPTAADGTTTFSQTLFAGGYSGRDPDKDPVDDVGGGNDALIVVVQGARIEQFDNNLFGEVRYKSPDYDGNLQVDLRDISVLAYELGRPDSWRSDFDHNGSVDLGDIARFVESLGAVCP